MKQVSGNIVDIYTQTVYPVTLSIDGGIIVNIRKDTLNYSNFIIPGLIDAHVHIESSMLIPAEFSKIALRHGTVATVSDPHEIANVMGIEGVRFMIENGRETKLKFNWAVPSCVPATEFETSGARLDVSDIDILFQVTEVVALGEMMNFPGIINCAEDVMAKIQLAHLYKLPIDGHAPSLQGNDLITYVKAGINTDHECASIGEAIEKIKLGMKILIREGSSAKNFDALAPLVDLYPDMVMFCCDDIHPQDLLLGHINSFLRKGIQQGLNLFNLIRAASFNPIHHYKLGVGTLQVNQIADFCIVGDLEAFDVLETWINGEQVFAHYNARFQDKIQLGVVNNFTTNSIVNNEIRVLNLKHNFRAIGVKDGELHTQNLEIVNIQISKFLESDIRADVLKILVVNRYHKASPSVGFVRGFGLKQGAVASTVAHDSHNIIAIGTNDSDLVCAVNLLMQSKGGIVAVRNEENILLPLPIAGLMSAQPAEEVAELYLQLNQKVNEFGSSLSAPFMTMSFLALLVIPELKICDNGLFDGSRFAFTPLFV